MFWLGVTTVMYENGKLKPTPAFYNTFNLGVAAGTLTANSLYILGGFYLADIIRKYESVMNGVLGAVFLILAIIKIVQMRKKKNKEG